MTEGRWSDMYWVFCTCSARLIQPVPGPTSEGSVVMDDARIPVDIDDAEGFLMSGVGESFGGILVLISWRVVMTQPPNVRQQNFGPSFRDIPAPSVELCLEPETRAAKQKCEI